LINIDIVLLQLVDGEITLEQLILTKRQIVRKELFFRLAELANAGSTPEEKTRYKEERLLILSSRLCEIMHLNSPSY
jgi:hypothetical protein